MKYMGIKKGAPGSGRAQWARHAKIFAAAPGQILNRYETHRYQWILSGIVRADRAIFFC